MGGSSTTVGQLQLRIQQKTGIDPKRQGSLMLNGKRLSPLDTLEDAGITKDGAHLNLKQSQGSPKRIIKTSKISSVDAADKWNKLVNYSAQCMSQVIFKSGNNKKQKNQNYDDDSTPSFPPSRFPRVMDIMKMWQKIVQSTIFEDYMNAGDTKELFAHVEACRLFLLKELRDNDGSRDMMGNGDPNDTNNNNEKKNSYFAAFQSTTKFGELPDPIQRAIKDPMEWRSLFLFYVEEFKTFDLNGSIVQDIKHELQELLDSGVMDQDPEMRQFIQENLKDDDNDTPPF